MLLVVDNGSAYTKNLTGFLSQHKINYMIKTPNQINLNDFDKIHSVILSGRKKNDTKMNAMNSAIIRFCISKNKPLLGICYGAEILALTLGGTIKKTAFHKGMNTVNIIKKNNLCKKPLCVFESHSYEISKLPNLFIRLGFSSNCSNEIIKLRNKPIYGTQFHPEMSLDGKRLIKKFLDL